ncbi:Glycine receptor subunit alphaZ1 [Aphelenchoides fujianensis]|nr:Glycine receptor subunit alphaZ1 [Aphelenchoides fujianensis]
MPERMEFEVIDDADRLEELGLDQYLLDEYESVGVLYKEICGNHARQNLVFHTGRSERNRDGRAFADLRSFQGISRHSFHPFIARFLRFNCHPDAETLTKLALQLNELILNSTKPGFVHPADATDPPAAEHFDWSTAAAPTHGNEDGQVLDVLERMHTVAPEIPRRVFLRIRRTAGDRAKVALTKVVLPVDIKVGSDEEATETPPVEEAGDQDWLEDLQVGSREILTVSKQLVERLESENVSLSAMEMAWIQIDATDGTNPLLYVLSDKAAESLRLKIPKHHFNRYEKVVLHLPGVCADYVPTAIDAFNASDFEGIEIEGPIGVNITALELAGVNLTELAETLAQRHRRSTRTLGGSYILPVLQKNQYDAFSAPIVFQGSAVVVRFGIYIESMSNFQTSTMDYDMDISLIMSWRDARLVNPYGKPILVKEEDILEKIWRPDPFFANAKEAEFHEVTFLNFLMRIFSDGIVLYETRIKLKPACNLVAYPVETVRFEWFTRKVDAIDKNPDVKLPELYGDYRAARHFRRNPPAPANTCRFVFFTLLQTLFVIGFDKRSTQLRKNANKKRSDLTQEYKDALVHKADRFHKTGQYLDKFCRAAYPLLFILFLIMYYFVFTEGRQDDCISRR